MTGWFQRLMVVTAATQLVVYVVRPVLTYQALAGGASTSDIALVVAAFSTVSLVVAIPVGRAVDRHGERRFVLAGAVVLTATVGALAIARSVPAIIAASAALGLGQLIAMVAIQTTIANGRDALRRDGRFVTFTLVTSTSQLLGPALGGLLVGGAVAGPGLELARVHVVAGVVALVGALAAASLVARPGTLVLRPQHSGRAEPGAMREVLGTPTVLIALVVGFAVLSAIDLLLAFLPAYGASLGMSPRRIGLLIAAHGLASIAVRLVLPALGRVASRRVLLTCSLVTAAASLGAVPWTESLPGLVALMVVSGAGLGVCSPIAIAWVAGAVRPEVRGTAMSLRLAGNRLGQTLVPAAVAAASGAAGLAAAFVLPAGLLLAAAVLLLVLGGTASLS